MSRGDGVTILWILIKILLKIGGVDILGDEILVINSNFGIAEYGKRKTSFTDAN